MNKMSYTNGSSASHTNSSMKKNFNKRKLDDDMPENEDVLSPVNLSLKFPVDHSNNYVLKSATSNDGSSTKFAVALSNYMVKTFDSQGKFCDEYKHTKSVTNVKFSSKEQSVLLTSSLDGKVHVWDTRCQGPVQTFLDDSDGALKPILSFDYNLNEEIICGGTEIIREDSFLLFWDRRSTKILGGYWNSHAGDITQIHFHPYQNSWMASSSMDGLINVYDLNKTSEDDALMQTLNFESPINTFTWESESCLSCSTSIEEFHVWEIENVQPIFSTSRQKLYEDFQVNVDYMIDSFLCQKNFFLATGNNAGQVHLWNMYRNSHNRVGYQLDGHSDVVRTICYNSNGLLLTGGDDGNVCFWKMDYVDAPSAELKVSKSLHKHRSLKGSKDRSTTKFSKYKQYCAEEEIAVE